MIQEDRAATEIGALIRARREANGWTRAKLSNLSGVNSDVIMKIELGHRLARLETLIPLANAFGLSLRELIPK